MENLKVFLGGLLGTAGLAGDRAARSRQHDNEQQQQQPGPRDPETLSASVNIEDIIDEYDEPSRRSRNTLDASQQQQHTDGKVSQSFFSFDNTRDDETTSFYSALNEGFSLENLEFTRNKSGRDFLWKPNNSNNDSDESDMMLRKSDFEISWIDLTYSIRPRATYAAVWDDFRERLCDGVTSAHDLLNYFRAARYDVSKTGAEEDLEGNSIPRDRITILNYVNGSFKSGEMTAVMGPSGAGKTSLLNILSRRREVGFTGRLCVSESNRRIKINAIPQHDHLLESLTVRENLTFASKLKNPLPNQDHAGNVDGVCHLLGLDECLDTRTGSVSGGQQKRLAIAQELLSKPDILILDEPTSGLDSLTCIKTLSVLRDLVKPTKRDMIDPIAILLTIHQPQREAFEMFDKVYVLANGGIAIYDGPPAECVSFIEEHSGLKLPNPDYNPATFLVEIASGEFGQEPIKALAQQVRLDARKRQANLWPAKLINELHSSVSPATTNQKRGVAVSEDITLEPNRCDNSTELDTISRASSTKSCRLNQKAQLFLDPRLVKSSSINNGKFFYKTLVLTQRCWKTLWRDPRQVLARVAYHLLLPIVLALVMGVDPGAANACPRFQSEYSITRLMQSSEYVSKEVQEEFMMGLENMAVLFVTMYSCVSANIAVMTLTFALDMRTCLKEYHNGWYSMTSYVFAKVFSNIPLDWTLPTATVALTFYITNQNTGTNDTMYFYRILITALALVSGSMIGSFLGMIFGAIYVGHITTALFASQGATLPFVLLSGFIARTKNMSRFVAALSYTSLYKHCLEASFIARYGWNVCGCDPVKMANKTVTITGIPDELRKFVNNWMESQNEGEAAGSAASVAPNSTALSAGPAHGDKDDVFQVIAKQLSLFNTYGVEVKSCEQVVPYEMHDFNLTESDLPMSFLALFALILTMMLTLLIVMQTILKYRKSL